MLGKILVKIISLKFGVNFDEVNEKKERKKKCGKKIAATHTEILKPR